MRVLLALLLVALSNACVAQNFCAKRQECNDALEDDSYAVCVEETSAEINSLRANKEEECHDLADALIALRACQANLDCDDFEEGDLGGKCDDELDDFEDALNNEDGECSSRD